MKTIKNYLYDAERFGLSPGKVIHRLSGDSDSLPKIVTVTKPKSGTNLLQRVLVLHPMLYRKLIPTLGPRNRQKWIDLDSIFKKTKKGQIISSHFDYSESLESYLINETNHNIVFMTRDPRDVVISGMFYLLKRKDHPYRRVLLKMKNEKDMLRVMIQGNGEIASINSQMKRFSGWVNPQVCVVKFEDMVGAAGGGDDAIQRESIQKLYNDLDVNIDEDLIEYIASNCRSSKTQTFRSGKINNWKIHFDDELKQLFREETGDLLLQMGYEKDIVW